MVHSHPFRNAADFLFFRVQLSRAFSSFIHLFLLFFESQLFSPLYSAFNCSFLPVFFLWFALLLLFMFTFQLSSIHRGFFPLAFSIKPRKNDSSFFFLFCFSFFFPVPAFIISFCFFSFFFLNKTKKKKIFFFFFLLQTVQFALNVREITCCLRVNVVKRCFFFFLSVQEEQHLFSWFARERETGLDTQRCPLCGHSFFFLSSPLSAVLMIVQYSFFFSFRTFCYLFFFSSYCLFPLPLFFFFVGALRAHSLVSRQLFLVWSAFSKGMLQMDGKNAFILWRFRHAFFFSFFFFFL